MTHSDIESATYSPEDNKLRLYPACRLDEDLFARVKAHGFKWAPKQGLFVAPKWTPNREDFCLELVDEITPEQTTMIERAEAKAARLDDIRDNSIRRGNAYADAAAAISKRFEFGQPILVGHHSERSARRDQAKMDRAMEKAAQAFNKTRYWEWRAEGVERHANMKNSDRTRANRIKTILKGMRDNQRWLNHCKYALKVWQKIEKLEGDELLKTATYYAGTRLADGAMAPQYSDYDRGIWNRLDNGTLQPAEAVQICLQYFEDCIEHPDTYRRIAHALNRLAYERSFFGETPRFTGELTAPVLQEMARNQGARKPKATADGDNWTLSSAVDLPAHIAPGETITLSADGWRDLMQSIGYTVEIKQRRKPVRSSTVSLFNLSVEDANKLQSIWNQQANDAAKRRYHRDGEDYGTEVIQLSQQQYSANSRGDYSACKTVEIDANGLRVHRSYKGPSAEPVAKIRIAAKHNGRIYGAYPIIHIHDKPVTKKPLPIDWDGYAKLQAAKETEAA